MQNTDSVSLTDKERRFREFVLNGNMWRVVFYVCIPLAAYQGFAQLFNILDSIMASHISTAAVSAVAYLSQITAMISAFGNGLAIGAGIKISSAYGAGDYELVKRRVSTVYAVCIVLGGLILALILPFCESFLRLSGTPDALIDVGKTYFSVSLGATVLSFFNTIFISIERSRGHSGKILVINISVMIIKFLLTAYFVYVKNGDVVSIALATLISQAVFLIAALFNMNIGSKSAFGFSVRSISMKKDCIVPVLLKSYPVVIEKAAFAFGKLIVNAMSVVYGDSTVGALGISNNIGGIATSLQNGFQDGGAAIISQNIGGGKTKRAIDAFYKIMIVCVVLGGVFMAATLLERDFISGLFAENDESFRILISEIYSYEALGAVMLGINAAVMALLYGFGYTKLTLVLNASRVLVFRIPVLWYLQNFTNVGAKSVGIVMMISNISVGFFALIAAYAVIKRMKKQGKLQ